LKVVGTEVSPFPCTLLEHFGRDGTKFFAGHTEGGDGLAVLTDARHDPEQHSCTLGDPEGGVLSAAFLGNLGHESLLLRRKNLLGHRTTLLGDRDEESLDVERGLGELRFDEDGAASFIHRAYPSFERAPKADPTVFWSNPSL